MAEFDININKRFTMFCQKYIGKSQAAAAEVCECSQKHISEVFNNKKPVSLKMAMHLYKKFRLNIDWLFEGGSRSWVRNQEPKESLITNIQELRGENAILIKYIEQMQKVVNKLVKDVYSDGTRPKSVQKNA
jgi:plasmid maintenance system antidote protein VapI